MTDRARAWTVRLTATAETDFQKIVQWTHDEFGEAQSLVYAETLSMALQALYEGPSVIGAKPRDDILRGLFSLHVARQGRKGRHFVMFRAIPGDDAIEVLRLLHDLMDLPRHIDTDETN